MLELWKTVERRPATPRAGESAGVLCTTREATQGVSCELALPRLYGGRGAGGGVGRWGMRPRALPCSVLCLCCLTC